MTYRQLTLKERYQLEALVQLGFSGVTIAKKLRRHPSTICRELQRNSDLCAAGGYVASFAMKATHKRRVDKGARSRKIQGKLRRLIERKLQLSWSPEQIAGRLRVEGGVTISHETIYQHILRDCRERGSLRYFLRFAGYKHHRFKKSKVAENTLLRKKWITQRPLAAEHRTKIGHWERDCLLGRRDRGGALLTLVDRRSRYACIRWVAKVDSAHVGAATKEALEPHRDVTKTVTNDNGREFGRDEALEQELGARIYFTAPSSPWQRGSIENLNGLIRQYIPKGVDMTKLPPWTTDALEYTLNHRPRKVLGFKTPHEVFFKTRMSLIDNWRMHFGLEFSSQT